MSKIQILPPQVANKIAAGEVVDRPASVVKELVENALDAEADEITVVIAKAGKELIQVIDNGSGMSEEEVQLAFQRHATSKIRDASDLDRIVTLGFRGEALPSIASVARVEVKTCPVGENVGVRLQLNGGEIADKEKIAFKPGTTIAVKNLFFNTPARRNFLRADVTEFNHILRSLKRFFLAYPEVKFTVIHNGETLFELPKATIDERITHVFGEKFYDGLVYVREEMGDTFLEGYVCRPDQARGTSENQFIFLNRRAIINRSLAHAIFSGYGNLIDRARYPQFIMFLEMHPRLVDVNVHPTKMEVRFANDQAIYHLFLNAVRRGIQSGGAARFSISSGEQLPPSATSSSPGAGGATGPDELRRQIRNLPKMDFAPPGTVPGVRKFQPGPSPEPETSQVGFDFEPMPPQKSEMVAGGAQKGEGSAEETVQPNLWQVHNRYIFAQIKNGVVIIDQHAAHERILFEKTLDRLKKNEKLPSQQLLFPQTVELQLEDFLIFEDLQPWLEKVGFAITKLSGRTIVIEAIPADVKVGSESQILLEMIDHYREHKGDKVEMHEKIAAAYAGKNAIKAGEKLSLPAMAHLVDQLFATREPYFGPGKSGRPVIVTMELGELDRRFKR